MFKPETIQGLAKMLKLDPQDFEDKLKSEQEEEITLPELKVFTSEEFDTRLKNEKTSSYTEGKDAGREMWVKERKKELNYDFEGNDPDKLLEFHTNKLKDSVGKPDERSKELEADIAKMKQANQEILQQKENELSQFKKQFNSQLISNKLMGIAPKDTTIPVNDVITLFNANYQTEVGEDGKIVVKQNGETLKDPTTASERPLENVFQEFVTSRNYVKKQAGRGGDNEFGDKGVQPKSISEFKETWTKKNPDKSATSSDYQKDYMDWRKENKEVTE